MKIIEYIAIGLILLMCFVFPVLVFTYNAGKEKQQHIAVQVGVARYAISATSGKIVLIYGCTHTNK